MTRENAKDERYKLGKIYKITAGDLTYYGSTIQRYLSSRLSGHRQDYRKWSSDKSEDYCYSFKLFEIDINPTITLVEDCPCERKEQLKARERHYIENNTCVNRYVPNRTDEETRILRKPAKQIQDKQRLSNPEKAQQNRERVREWRINNRERRNARSRERYATKKLQKSDN